MVSIVFTYSNMMASSPESSSRYSLSNLIPPYLGTWSPKVGQTNGLLVSVWRFWAMILRTFGIQVGILDVFDAIASCY